MPLAAFLFIYSMAIQLGLLLIRLCLRCSQQINNPNWLILAALLQVMTRPVDVTKSGTYSNDGTIETCTKHSLQKLFCSCSLQLFNLKAMQVIQNN